MGELFYLSWETLGDAFNFGVFHFGPKKGTEVFKYGIKIGNSEEHVTVTRKCHSYVEGGLKDLQPEKYVQLYYNTILNCLSENTDLTCEIEIGRETLDGFSSEESEEYSQLCVIGYENVNLNISFVFLFTPDFISKTERAREKLNSGL